MQYGHIRRDYVDKSPEILEFNRELHRCLFVRRIVLSWVIPFLALWGPRLWAEERCQTISTPEEVIQCALQNHPAVQRAKAGIVQTQALESRAGQRPNPELNSKSTFGELLGDVQRSTEIGLVHTFELGGKRGARIERAQAENSVSEASLLSAQYETYLSTVITLNRLRQIELESKILDEALTAFERIQKQMKSRPRLSPDLEVSLSVFQMAYGDYQLRQSALESERVSLEKTIALSIGRDVKITSSLLPQKRKEWPKLTETKPQSSPLNLRTAGAHAELGLAQSEYSLAQSESWPDLRLGPVVEFHTDGALSNQLYGFTVSLPLPLFHLNGGGRAVALRGVQRAELNISLLNSELSLERSALLNKYKSAIESLKKIPSFSELSRKHSQVEKLFDRGLIASSLVIEAHRQMIDFTKSEHEQELSALDALIRVYALDSKLFKENL